jgi:hypothetical protein
MSQCEPISFAPFLTGASSSKALLGSYLGVFHHTQELIERGHCAKCLAPSYIHLRNWKVAQFIADINGHPLGVISKVVPSKTPIDQKAIHDLLEVQGIVRVVYDNAIVRVDDIAVFELDRWYHSGLMYVLHAWHRHYKESDILKEIRSAQDVDELLIVATDAKGSEVLSMCPLYRRGICPLCDGIGIRGVSFEMLSSRHFVSHLSQFHNLTAEYSLLCEALNQACNWGLGDHSLSHELNYFSLSERLALRGIIINQGGAGSPSDWIFDYQEDIVHEDDAVFFHERLLSEGVVVTSSLAYPSPPFQVPRRSQQLGFTRSSNRILSIRVSEALDDDNQHCVALAFQGLTCIVGKSASGKSLLLGTIIPKSLELRRPLLKEGIHPSQGVPLPTLMRVVPSVSVPERKTIVEHLFSDWLMDIGKSVGSNYKIGIKQELDTLTVRDATITEWCKRDISDFLNEWGDYPEVKRVSEFWTGWEMSRILQDSPEHMTLLTPLALELLEWIKVLVVRRQRGQHLIIGIDAPHRRIKDKGRVTFLLHSIFAHGAEDDMSVIVADNFCFEGASRCISVSVVPGESDATFRKKGFHPSFLWRALKIENE